MMDFLLWQIRLEERQKFLRGASALFRRRSGSRNAAGGACTGQCRLGRFVLGQICGEVRGERWGRWLWDSMEFFYGADVSICRLDIKGKTIERV